MVSFNKDAGNPDGHSGPRQHRHVFALASRRRSLPAGLLNRMGGIEDHRRTGLARQIGNARMSDTSVL
jgi:hypothetical protein